MDTTSKFFTLLTESSANIEEAYRGLVPDDFINAVGRISDPDWKLYFLQWRALMEWASVSEDKRNTTPRIRKIIRSIVRKSGERRFNGAGIADQLIKLVYKAGTTLDAIYVNHVATFINKGEPTYITDIANLDKWKMFPLELIQKVQELERASSIRGIPEEIVNDNEDEVLIDFGDGFAWWKLDRASCPWEAKAGGHCGNEPRGSTNDIILSLRERKVDGDGNPYYKVHLTFVLSYGGYLTEMKARFNEKPGEEYHKYIIPLLEHPIVQGIAEGFYATKSDFSIDDLPDDERDRLVNLKPELAEPDTDNIATNVINDIGNTLEKNKLVKNYDKGNGSVYLLDDVIDEIIDDISDELQTRHEDYKEHAKTRLELRLNEFIYGILKTGKYRDALDDYLEDEVYAYYDNVPEIGDDENSRAGFSHFVSMNEYMFHDFLDEFYSILDSALDELLERSIEKERSRLAGPVEIDYFRVMSDINDGVEMDFAFPHSLLEEYVLKDGTMDREKILDNILDRIPYDNPIEVLLGEY